MERILINTANAEDLENIEDQLDANGVDYDYDEGGRMIVSEEDMDIHLISMQKLSLELTILLS